MQDADSASTHVFLEGDSGPLPSCLVPEQVAALIFDVEESGASWVRLPLSDGRVALVRPQAFAAIVPVSDDDD